MQHKFFVYRNTAVEYLFKNLDTQYSGYGDFSSSSDSDRAIILFYFLPYTYNREQLLSFIDDYYQRAVFITREHPNQTIYIVGLYNYFYDSFVFTDDAVVQAINQLNGKLNRIDARFIDISPFFRQFSSAEIFSPKFYYLYNAVINPKYGKVFQQWLLHEISLRQNTRKKCLIVDLDNTLWGGILGEDGIENLEVSGNYPGNCYYDFRQLLLELKAQGVILCLCSKNNEEDVLECFQKRDDLVLKLDDFAIQSFGWDDKASRILSIANELNISTHDIVFVDDSPTERALVSGQIKDLTVLDFPAEPYLLVETFKKQFRNLFSSSSLTPEDLGKTDQYQYKKLSDDLRHQAVNEDDFIRQLHIQIIPQAMNDFTATRFEQLVNKSNQFNLTTKRYTIADLKILAKNHLILGIRVLDKFGDLGITGISIVKLDGQTAIIDSFLMSCRILGRKIEYEFLKLIINKLYRAGIKEVYAEYIPSPKNMQTQNFYSDFGFQMQEQSSTKTVFYYKIETEIKLDSKYIIKEDYDESAKN